MKWVQKRGGGEYGKEKKTLNINIKFERGGRNPMPHSPHLDREKNVNEKKDGKTRCFFVPRRCFFPLANLLRGYVERDGPKVHLLVGLDTGEDEKQTCAVESIMSIGGQSKTVLTFLLLFRSLPRPSMTIRKGWIRG